ncbi:MAG: hypothetical protein KHX03_01405 [Clostridium sp.]|nr:hypothetical protein [Clostridium sp.]
MGIQVQKTESGWIVNKGGISFSITDNNKNGKYDSGDLCKELSGKGNTLSADDLIEVKYQILQQGDGATQSEMTEYSRYKERKTQQEKLQQQQQQYMQQFQPKPKKKGFWGTVGQIATTVLSGVSGFLGMMIGFGGGANAWAFNNTANDWAVRGFSGFSSGMLDTSTMLGSAGLGSFGLTGGTNFNAGLAQVISAAQMENAQRTEQMNQILEEQKAKAEETKAKQEKEANAKGIENLYESIGDNEDEKVMAKANVSKLEEIYDVGKEDYTDEEIETAKKIKKYQHVPVDHISDKGGEKTKLDPSVAAKLNEKLGKYKNETNESKQQDILTPENYKKLKSLLAKQQLTEKDIEIIKTILKKPLENQ